MSWRHRRRPPVGPALVRLARLATSRRLRRPRRAKPSLSVPVSMMCARGRSTGRRSQPPAVDRDDRPPLAEGGWAWGVVPDSAPMATTGAMARSATLRASMATTSASTEPTASAARMPASREFRGTLRYRSSTSIKALVPAASPSLFLASVQDSSWVEVKALHRAGRRHQHLPGDRSRPAHRRLLHATGRPVVAHPHRAGSAGAPTPKRAIASGCRVAVYERELELLLRRTRAEPGRSSRAMVRGNPSQEAVQARHNSWRRSGTTVMGKGRVATYCSAPRMRETSWYAEPTSSKARSSMRGVGSTTQ